MIRIAALLAVALLPMPRQAAPIGPLGHWKGDDGSPPSAVADSSGNGYAGKYSAGSGTSTEVAAVKFANPSSMTFDGATGVVTIPDAQALRIEGDITIAFWMRKTANVNDWCRLVGKGNGGQRNYGVWMFPGGDGHLKFQCYNAGGGSVLDLDSPGNAVTPLNTWCHVVCSVSVNSASLWLNGALVANGVRTGPPGVSADPVTFGFAGYHAYYAGQLDDVRIYNRALSTTEILYLAAGSGAPAPPADFAAAKVEPRKIALKWTPSPTPPPAGTATYYTVRRSTTSGTGFAVIASGFTEAACTDEKVEPDKTYFYVVTAVNSAGESAGTAELKVTVPK